MECYFCQRNIQDVNVKETRSLERFISGLGKIRPRRKTNLCAKHQRYIAKTIKRARHLGLLSSTGKRVPA